MFWLVSELLLNRPLPHFLSSVCTNPGLNILIYLQEIEKGSPVSRSYRIAMEIIHVEIPVGANFHLFLVVFALPEEAVLEVT